MADFFISKAELKALVRQCIIKEDYIQFGQRTVAIITIVEPITGERHSVLGYATCNPKDTYSAKQGREIAKGLAVARAINRDYDDDTMALDFFKRWLKDIKRFNKQMRKEMLEAEVEVAASAQDQKMPVRASAMPKCIPVLKELSDEGVGVKK